jgi:hypothetical protein
MIIPFMILLIGLNAMFMVVSTLPNNVQATSTYASTNAFGLTDLQQSSITNQFVDINEDSTNLSGQIDLNRVNVSTREQQAPTNLFAVLYDVLGAIWIFLKYVYTFFFGFTIWVDFFLPPTITTLAYLGWVVKGVFFFIQIIGLMTILSMVMSAWRR